MERALAFVSIVVIASLIASIITGAIIIYIEELRDRRAARRAAR